MSKELETAAFDDLCDDPTVHDGDAFVVGYWNMRGFVWLDSDDSLENLMSKVPDCSDADSVDVCQVVGAKWKDVNAGEQNPVRLHKLYTITFHDDPEEG